VIEFHEVLDTGEARLAFASSYVRIAAPLLMRLASGFVVHSRYDHDLVEQRYGLGRRPVALIPLGPFDQYHASGEQSARRSAPSDACNLLFFGVIRPFKGLEDLIAAFDAIPEDEIGRYWLTVVGETWEGWTLPGEMIARARYRDRMTFVNRYVPDEEVASYFAGADAVVLPYHRSSSSGPVHVAMSHGLPLVLTSVGGLPESVAGSEGAIQIPTQDPVALRATLARAAEMRGQCFSSHLAWDDTVQRYTGLFEALQVVPTAQPDKVTA
jgi:glycosyltransferase involved in cell wall biosynthesis